MAEHASKFEHSREGAVTIEDLAKEVSNELRYTNGNFVKACDKVLDRQGITYNLDVRAQYKSDIGKILGKHSAEMNPGKPKSKKIQSVQPADLYNEGNVRRIKKMQEANPLFSEEIAKKEDLKKFQKQK